MATPVSAHETWRFGVYEVDTRKMQVRRAGVPIKLRDQSFLILVHLLEHAGEIVTHDELCRVLWPSDTFVDFDHSLRTAVMKLRDALGDSVDAPVYIETIPKRGYRFVAPVVAGDGESFASSLTTAEADAVPVLEKQFGSEKVSLNPSLKRKLRRWFPWAVGVAAIAVVIGTLFWRIERPVTPPELKAVAEIPGDARMPSLSPDGKRVAFAWNGGKGEVHNVYVHQVGSTGPPLQLTNAPAHDHFPAWSPDDRWIAFVRDPQNAGDASKIILVPPLGGPERSLAGFLRPGTQSEPGTNLSWSPDGKWLAFSAAESTFGAYNVWAVSIETGERRRLTTFPTQLETADLILGDRSPSFSPDGSTLAFARSAENRVFYIYVQALTPDLKPKGEVRRVTDQQFSFVDGIAWTPNGRDVVFSAGDLGAGFLWQVRASGGMFAKRLSFSQADSEQPTFAGSPPRLVYTWTVSGSALMEIDTRTHQIRTLSERSAVSSHPDYSPDGRKIAFQSTSTRTGNSEIWTCDADGGNCSQLTSFNGPRAGTPSWSPDGQLIALSGRVEGQLAIYVITADGGRPRRVTSYSGNNLFPSWSHDSNWIYFGSNRSGRNEIWKVPKNGGAEVQVTHSGGYASSESPDGKYLYYSKDDNHSGLFRMPTAGGAEEQVLPKIGHVNSFAITADGIYFLPDDTTIQFLDFVSGRVSTLAHINRPTGLLAVKPGDHYLAWIQQSPRNGSLVQVEDFR